MPYTDNPDTNLLDQVRLLIGDTDNANLEFTDNAIDFFLDQSNMIPIRAAYRAALAAAAKYARRVSATVGGVSLDYRGISDQWKSMAQNLKFQGGAIGVTMDPGPPLVQNAADKLKTATSWGDYII